MKKKQSIVLWTIAALIAVTVFARNLTKEQKIFINEVRSWDTDAKRTGYAGSDYIELYNASSEAVSLEGWYISDDEMNLKKCRLYDAWMEPGEYLLLYANGKNDSGTSLNFKIDPTGEKLFLSDADGSPVDSVYVPEQEYGTVYARMTDGGKNWAVMESSVLTSNNDCQIYPVRSLKIPEFSHESGFYEESFVLTLEAGRGEKIYYTLDGSEPTENSLLYEDGILIENRSAQPNVLHSVRNVVLDWKDYEPDQMPVDKAVVVRAVSVNASGAASEIVTKTYLVDLDQYKDQNIVSLTAEFEEMFGEDGIFVTGREYDEAYLAGTLDESQTANFLQSGRNWEIQGNMELFRNGKSILNHGIGIRTQGGGTRMLEKKKMSLYARKEYSDSPYFDGWKLGERKIHSAYMNHSVSNIIFPELVKDRKLETQSAEKSTVFLNGEYWFQTYLLEKYNKYYLNEKYNKDLENVIIIKDEIATDGPEGAYESYLELLAFAAAADFSDTAQYEELKQRIDIQSYIDYVCANVYLCNMDVSETKNAMLWRTVTEDGTENGDTRWRWMFYDVDCIEWVSPKYYEAESKAAIDSFTKTMQYTGVAIDEHTIYAACKENPEFRKQFVLSFLDMANVNFSKENVDKAFAKWEIEQEKLFQDFFAERFDHIVPDLAEEFGLTGTLETVTLKINDTAGGKIYLNTTMPDLTKGSWMGRYYTDYPVTVTAVPAEGYEFVGWSGSIVSESGIIEAEVLPGGITLEAVFEKAAEEP